MNGNVSDSLLERMAPCPCGSRYKPRVWRKYSRSFGQVMKCWACGLTASVSATTGDGLVANWNEAVAKDRERRRPTTLPVEIVAPWPPRAGYYATRLVKEGPRVGVRIWFGQPIIDGEVQDRAPRWNVEINGRTDRWEKNDDTGYRCRVAFDIDRFWPYVAREPITADEYAFLKSHEQWAVEHQPSHPKATPYKAVDFNTLAPRV